MKETSLTSNTLPISHHTLASFFTPEPYTSDAFQYSSILNAKYPLYSSTKSKTIIPDPLPLGLIAVVSGAAH